MHKHSQIRSGFHVGDQPIRSKESAEYSIRWIDSLKEIMEADQGWRSQKEKDHVFAQLEGSQRHLPAICTRSRRPVAAETDYMKLSCCIWALNQGRRGLLRYLRNRRGKNAA